MEYSGGLNLFTSHFIMGTIEADKRFTKTETKEIKALHLWLNFKNTDWALDKFKNRTQYVAFLHCIELNDLNQILNDLATIYKKSYPYAEKKDFIEYFFSYTLYDLETLVSSNPTFYGQSKVKDFDFYYLYDQPCSEFCDFAIASDKTINFYKQYFRKVIALIKNIEFDNSSITSKTTSSQQLEVKIADDTLKNMITHTRCEEIAENIKVHYKNIKGKQLKLLFLAMQHTQLLPTSRVASKFHRSCFNDFDWDIGSYNAMNDYDYNEFIDQEEFSQMKAFFKEQKSNK